MHRWMKLRRSGIDLYQTYFHRELVYITNQIENKNVVSTPRQHCINF